MDAHLLGTVEEIADGWIRITVPFWFVAIGDSIAVNLDDDFHAITGLKIRDEQVEKITSHFTPFQVKADTLNHARVQPGDRIFFKKNTPPQTPADKP
ncbi:MAG: hypothetical protein WC528_03640 [Patescibacteria group bacterium]